MPREQGPDIQTVIPLLDLTTMAAAGVHSLSHVHFIMVETTRPTTLEEVRDIFQEALRLASLLARDCLVALNSVIELVRDLKRPRADMWEVVLW